MVITWLYDCLSTPIKIWSVPVTVPRNNAVLFMKWHTQTISKSLNNSNKLLSEKTTDIIKWCHGCRFPCEKMSEEQVLKFHTLTWRVTTLIWVISLHQYGISAGSFLNIVLQGNLQQRHRLMLAVFSGYIIIAAATMMHPLNCISSYYCGLRFTTNQSHKCFEVTVYLETNWAIQQIFTVCV